MSEVGGRRPFWLSAPSSWQGISFARCAIIRAGRIFFLDTVGPQGRLDERPQWRPTPRGAAATPRVSSVADESHWWAWAALAIAVFVLLVIIIGMMLGHW